MKLQKIKYSRQAAFALLIFVAALASGCSESGKGEKKEAATVGSDSAAAALSVQVVQPVSENWGQSIKVNGAIKAWQEIIVSPETGGLRLEELLVDVGASVRRGQLLARLSDTSVKADLRKQEAAVAQAKAKLQQAQGNHERAVTSGQSGALSAQQIDEYRNDRDVAKASLESAIADRDSAQLKLKQTRILAQDDGVVASKSGVLGDVVTSGAELYRLIRQVRLEWLPEVDARQLAAIQPGQNVRLVLPDGHPVKGQVRVLGPVLDTSTGRATVHVSLEPGNARAGMFASGEIDVGNAPALTVPQSALSLRDGRSYVWMVDDKHKVTSRVVTTGRNRNGRVEILTGLTPNDLIVNTGGTFLSEGATVKVLPAQGEKK
jgi:RND family efflux transporter MFP subunit